MSNRPRNASTMIGRCNGVSISNAVVSTFSLKRPHQRPTTWSMHAVRLGHVVGFHGREHTDPQLVAAQLAIALGVDDVVRA